MVTFHGHYASHHMTPLRRRLFTLACSLLSERSTHRAQSIRKCASQGKQKVEASHGRQSQVEHLLTVVNSIMYDMFVRHGIVPLLT